MPDDVDDRQSPAESAAPTPADFDEGFAASEASEGLRRVWHAAEPDLPIEIEPFSFLSVGLLDHLSRALALTPGQLLVDLASGRGGPGLWLARRRQPRASPHPGRNPPRRKHSPPPPERSHQQRMPLALPRLGQPPLAGRSARCWPGRPRPPRRPARPGAARPAGRCRGWLRPRPRPDRQGWKTAQRHHDRCTVDL